MNHPNQVTLVIFDVFGGQKTDDVLKSFKQNHIDTVFVPANMTGILQPLNLTAKSIEEIDVKLQLTTLKSLHADWLVELYNEMTKSEGKEVIMSGWKAAGIIEAIKKGFFSFKLCAHTIRTKKTK